MKLIAIAAFCVALLANGAHATTVKINAANISADIQDNEVAVMQKLKGNDVIVTGVVKRIMSSIGDGPVVALQGEGFFGVQVRMNDEGVAARLRKGQRVTLSGTNPDIILGSLVLRNGALYKPFNERTVDAYLLQHPDLKAAAKKTGLDLRDTLIMNCDGFAGLGKLGEPMQTIDRLVGGRKEPAEIMTAVNEIGAQCYDAGKKKAD